MKRLKGFRDLVFDIVRGSTDLAEHTHRQVSDQVAELFPPVDPARAAVQFVNTVQMSIASSVYTSVRWVNNSVHQASRVAADAIPDGLGVLGEQFNVPVRSDAVATPGWALDLAEGAINGWYGDILADQDHTLSLDMSIRHEGRSVPLEAAAIAAAYPSGSKKICVLVHSLCSTEWLWSFQAEKHYGDPALGLGARLERDFGYTPIYVRYNTGRSLRDNGIDLAALITDLCEVYPQGVEDIVLLGHSMGGLVAKYAAHNVQQQSDSWASRLNKVICIGSPHEGSFLERFARAVEGRFRLLPIAGTQLIADLLQTRSKGIRDLYNGRSELDEVIPFVSDVSYHYIGGTLMKDTEHLACQFIGDILVAPHSALESERQDAMVTRDIVGGLNHISLVNHPSVYAAIVSQLASRQPLEYANSCCR